MSKASEAREARNNAAMGLLNDFQSGNVTTDRDGKPVVYGLVTHVARSGMSRHVRLFMIYGGDLCEITNRAARALGWRTNSRGDGIVVHGCGMDMVFHTVYELARTVYSRLDVPNGDRGYALHYRGM